MSTQITEITLIFKPVVFFRISIYESVTLDATLNGRGYVVFFLIYFSFLAILRQRLIKICLLSVVGVVIVNISHFHVLRDHWDDFNLTWRKASLGEENFSLFK